MEVETQRDMLKNIACVLTALVLFTGCEQLDELTHFNIPLEQSVVIPANSAVGTLVSIPIGEFETNLGTLLEQHDSGLDLIEQIFLESMQIEVETPNGSDLDHLNQISVHLKSATSPVFQVGWKDPVPTGTGESLELDIWEDTNLKIHFTQDVVTIRVDLEADQVTTVDQTVNFKALFRVNAKVLGI